jgi:hypothetical protein
MPTLLGRKGGISAEGRQVRTILKRVIFKENPKMGESVFTSMVHMEKHHGPKFVVDYFKWLKSLCISGKKLPRAQGRTIIRAVKSLNRVLQLRLTNIVGRWKARTPTKSDYHKFQQSVNKGRKFTGLDEFPLRKFRFKPEEIRRFHRFIPDVHIRWSPLQATGTHVLENNATSKGPVHISEEIYALTDAGEIFLRHSGYIQDIFDINPELMDMLCDLAFQKRDNKVIGRIAGLVKDGGLKTRYIANLIKGWQVAISPLVGFYKAIESTYPQSANWDQLDAAIRAACATRDGFNLTSTDIVSSTDNIPRDLFFHLMDPVIASLPDTHQGWLLRNAYQLDKDLCELGVYLTPYDQRVWYDIGQAMGRWTSKQQLDITMIKASAAVGGNGSNSAINGDDVVIWDDRVSQNFDSLLNRWDIPISEMKSFSMCPNGEFSGRIITRDDGILPVYKGRELNFSDDPLGAFRQYGEDGLVLLPIKLRKVISDVMLYLNEIAVLDLSLDPSEGKLYDPVREFIVNFKDLPRVENYGHTKEWVEQVFDAELNAAVKTVELIAYHEDITMFAKHKNLTPLQLMAEQSKEIEELKKVIRRRQGFTTVAVNRFSRPNSRLNLLIDNLNSYRVVTSDGHVIHGYGNSTFAKLMEDLKGSNVLSTMKGHDPHEAITREERLQKIRVFNRLARKVRKMNKALASERLDEEPTGIFGRFIDWFFAQNNRVV